MPSKMQHELNKIRGKTIIKEEKYTDTIAELKEKIVILEKEVLILDEEKIKHLSKINKITTLSKNAYQRATEQHDDQRHKNRIRTIQLTIPYWYDCGVSGYCYDLDPDVNETLLFRFEIPKDFIKINEIKLRWMNRGFEAGSTHWITDINLYHDQTGNSLLNSSNSLANVDITIPAGEILIIQETILNNSLFTDVLKNDIVTLEIVRDAVNGGDTCIKDIGFINLEFDYIADM